MKIKCTQRTREADVDTDFALAMALEEDEAGMCSSEDDDFQGTGPSLVFFKQTTALRSCTVKKHSIKRALPKNLKLGKERRGSGENGDVGHLLDRAAVLGKEAKVHSDVVVGSLGASTVSQGIVMEGKNRGFKEPKEADRGVLKDHSAGSTERTESGCVSPDAIMLANGDEKEQRVSSGKFQKSKVLSTPSLEPKLVQGSNDLGRYSSVACGHSDLQRTCENVLDIESKRKREFSICGTGWDSLAGDTKRTKMSYAGDPDNAGIRKVAQTEGISGLDSFSLESSELDLEANFDEDMVVCTEAEASFEVEFGQSSGDLGQVATGREKKNTEDRPKQKHNIYDILLGNHRTDRVLANVSSSDVNKEFECDEVEEMETPGTALRALIDEAELDYEGLQFDDDENDSLGSFGCPICGIDLVDLSVSDRQQHVSDCLEKDSSNLEATDPVKCLVQGAIITDATEPAQLSNQQRLTFETFKCPVCGMSIEGASIIEREAHISTCLDKDNHLPSESPGNHLSRVTGTTEVGRASQLLTCQRNVVVETFACPVCGSSLEELSISQREEHTNTCLDEIKGEGRVEFTECAGVEVAQAPGGPDVGPVVTWLTNLNLGKYVDNFVKAEIDWDTLKWLTEEDLNSLGITALGPRRKIICEIQQLRKSGSTKNSITAMQEGQGISDSVVNSPADTLRGSRKSIADFFIPPNTRQRVPAPDHITLPSSKTPNTAWTAAGSARNRGQGRPLYAGGNLRSIKSSGVPVWMCIPGTSFRVDSFKYTTGNCSYWFLTHFHADHYQGLTQGFRHGKILCSTITARLVKLRLGVPTDLIQALPLNETVLIDGVRVTFIDANHCPGAVMILFEPPNGKAVLHTGDFRFCSDMMCNEFLRSCRISTLILDTTYCDPQYDFPKQDAVVQFVIDAIQAEAFNTKTLFLIGTYTIGKERIYLEVGKALQKHIYVGAAKRRVLDCMDLAEEDRRWLTTKDQESHIHVVPLWSVASFKRMGSISRHYHGRYNSIVAFSPTGWTYGKDKKRIQGRPGRRYQQGSIIRYEVPYSEHSSFTELKEFVRTIGPENIVPHVFGRKGLTADAMVASLLSEEN